MAIDPKHVCAACEGKGMRIVRIRCSPYDTSPDHDFVRPEWRTCSVCKGSGLSPAGVFAGRAALQAGSQDGR